MPRSRSRNRGGRPRLDRERILYYPCVERPLAEEIAHQADLAGIPFGPYVELVLAELHGRFGPYLPNVKHPLPLPIPFDDLVRRCDSLDPQWCRGGAGPKRTSIRVDPPLAQAIQARSAELGVQASQYVRAVMRVMAGVDAAQPARDGAGLAHREGRSARLASVP